ncbi:hypothetical protein GCM10011594_15410 [Nakamurella endophytica]|uniref:DUF541 domain-containing protein n=1 Tax=Nakamurella endophytica TaxID=1748367 RepID=A0A917WES9_9ACTN|nr:hypothetical protein GCM10011594_15410 [Nakamurella endophytica]
MLAVAAGCSTGTAAGDTPARAAGESATGQAPVTVTVTETAPPAAPTTVTTAAPTTVPTTAPPAGQAVGGSTPGPAWVVTAQAVGTATGAPDTLTVQLGVQTRAKSASAALADNSTRAAAVIAVLKSSGVKPADLRTAQLSINPVRNRAGAVAAYDVQNVVVATLHDIARAGALIDAAQRAAGNAIRVDWIGFSIADDSAVRAAARADAVRRARAQAEQMAAAAGLALGPVQSITENPRTDGYNPAYGYASGAASAGAAAPIEPGSQDLSVTVEVVFALG